MTDTAKVASPIGRALVIAALMLATTGALALLSPQYISAELARRLLGALLGFVVMVYANAIPKALTPLALLRCNPATEQSLRRFTGWTLALGGLLYALSWMAAPIGIAGPLAIAALAATVLLAIGRNA